VRAVPAACVVQPGPPAVGRGAAKVGAGEPGGRTARVGRGQVGPAGLSVLDRFGAHT